MECCEAKRLWEGSKARHHDCFVESVHCFSEMWFPPPPPMGRASKKVVPFGKKAYVTLVDLIDQVIGYRLLCCSLSSKEGSHKSLIRLLLSAGDQGGQRNLPLICSLFLNPWKQSGLCWSWASLASLFFETWSSGISLSTRPTSKGTAQHSLLRRRSFWTNRFSLQQKLQPSRSKRDNTCLCCLCAHTIRAHMYTQMDGWMSACYSFTVKDVSGTGSSRAIRQAHSLPRHPGQNLPT